MVVVDQENGSVTFLSFNTFFFTFFLKTLKLSMGSPVTPFIRIQPAVSHRSRSQPRSQAFSFPSSNGGGRGGKEWRKEIQ